MKKTSLFSRMLQSNQAMLIFALIISFSIWVYMSFNTAGNDTTLTLSNLPIQVELAEEASNVGLQVFTPSDPKASVTVTGNRSVLGLVSESDFTVTASANSIDSAGVYLIPVSVAKKPSSGNFQIKSNSPSSISVTVDYFKETEFQIQNGVSFHVQDGYYGSSSLSHSTIVISGPQTDVLKIKKVVAEATINGNLKESQDVETEIVLYDENDNKLSKKLLKLSYDTMTATATVVPQKTVKVEPVFNNKPEGLKLTKDILSYSPVEVQLAGPKETLDNVKKAELEAIDFSLVSNEKMSFEELSITGIPENCKNVSSGNTAKLTLDMSGMAKKSFTVDKFNVTGLSANFSAEVSTQNIAVTVIGPKAEIDALNAETITAVIDGSDSLGKTGSVEMPVSFKFSGASSCWAFGTYQANVNITKK